MSKRNISIVELIFSSFSVFGFVKFGQEDKQEIIHLLWLDFEIFQLFLKKSKHRIQISRIDFSVSGFEELILLLEIVVDLPPLRRCPCCWKALVSELFHSLDDVFPREVFHSLLEVQLMQKVITKSFLGGHLELFEHD